MNLVPLQDRVILKRIVESEEPKKGCLILPSSQLKQDRYQIVARSDSTVGGPVTIGFVVFVEKYKGQIILQDGVEYLIVKLDDIIAYERTP